MGIHSIQRSTLCLLPVSLNPEFLLNYKLVLKLFKVLIKFKLKVCFVFLFAGSQRDVARRRETSSVVQDGVEHGHPVAAQHQVLRRGSVLQHGSTAGRHPERNSSFKQ